MPGSNPCVHQNEREVYQYDSSLEDAPTTADCIMHDDRV